MLKEFFDFILTGISVVLLYFIYFISSFITTIIIGIPIGLGIKFVIDVVDALYKSWMH
jgi:hypothetical protein